MFNPKPILLLSCLLVLFTLSTVSANELPLVLSENWDTSGGQLPAPWQVLPRANSLDTPDVSQDMALSGKYSLRVWRTPGAGNQTNWVAVTFPTLKERTVISFSFWASDLERSMIFSATGNDLGLTTLLGGSAGPFMSIMKGGVRSYVTEYVDQATYKAQQWHRLSLDINLTTRTYDVYLDGVKTNAAPVGFRNSDIATLTAFGIGFHAATATAGYKPVYVDDFEIRGY